MMKRFFHDESGATAIEYGLIVAVIVIAMLVGLVALGNNSSGSLGATSNKVSEVM